MIQKGWKKNKKKNKHGLRIHKWDSSVKMPIRSFKNMSCHKKEKHLMMDSHFATLFTVPGDIYWAFIVRQYIKHCLNPLKKLGRVRNIFIFILQMWKVRHKEVKKFAWDSRKEAGVPRHFEFLSLTSLA